MSTSSTSKMLKPKIGSVVEVTTKHRNYYHNATDEWKYNHYKGVVVSSQPWHTPTSFALKTGNEHFPISIIELANVTDIKYIKGSGEEIDVRDKEWRVSSARDPKKFYTVKLKNGKWSCNCDGYMYRKSCRHISERKIKHEKGNKS